MSKQQQARDALRAAWPVLLSETLADALTESQEEEAAAVVIQGLWPALRPDEIVLLDRADPNFLLRGSVIPTGFDVKL